MRRMTKLNSILPTAWLFDVDGVLTHPEQKTVTQSAIYDELLARLQLHQPVGLNTGRSSVFIEQVLMPLETRVRERGLLQYLVAIGEKGAIQLDYDKHGNRLSTIEPHLTAPPELQEDVRQLIQHKPRYGDVMFFDETKQTMISLELRVDKTVADFRAPQEELVQELHGLLQRHGLEDEFCVDATRIATDIQHRSTGKAYGTAKFLQALATRRINPVRYVCFGDSASDYDMLAELQRRYQLVTLVFVGEPSYLSGKDTHHVNFTHQLFDKGTLEYLVSHR